MVSRRQMLAGSLAAAIAPSAAAATATPAAGNGLFDTHDALGLADLVRQRQVSAQELLDIAIDRVEAANPLFNFMAQRHYDYARAAIARGLPQGPFTGVPWLLKDLNTNIAGQLSEGGSLFYRGNRPTTTSELVLRFERAGLVVFGKTNVPEFGLSATTENRLVGATRNPWNRARVAGGSSGGAAAAVAAGVVPAAHATDGGGSIRIPASCCGLFGLKPSRGRVPMGPPRTEGWGGLSTHHAVTRSVRDSAALLDAVAGIEPGSRYGAPTPPRPFLAEVGRDPGRLRIALMVSPFSHTPVDPECARAVMAAARLCEHLGHHVEEAAPVLDAAQLGAASFAIIGGSIAADVVDRAQATGLDPAVCLEPITQAFVEYGKHFTAMDYARANSQFQTAALVMAQFMERYDVILSPTLAAPPVELGRINLSAGVDMASWGQRSSVFAPYTGIANMTGQPAMSLPLAMSDGGLPIGVQFIGRYGEESLLFRLASQIEQASPWAGRRAPLRAR